MLKNLLLISIQLYLVSAALPCPPTLFFWSVLASYPNSTSYIVQFNPGQLSAIFPFQKLDLTKASQFDEQDSQFAVSTGKNSLSLLNAETGETSNLDYIPKEFSIDTAAGSMIDDSSDILIALGGSYPLCATTPIIRIDLVAGTASMEACVGSENFIRGVVALDEYQNIFYYASVSQLIGVNLNNSAYVLQFNAAGVANIFSDYVNDRLWFSQGPVLFLLSKQVPSKYFDFSTVFSNSVGSALMSGAVFDEQNQLLHGAYLNNDGNPSITYFTLDVARKSILLQTTVPQDHGSILFNYVKMGWICQDVEHNNDK